jgi:hypothetical protein
MRPRERPAGRVGQIPARVLAGNARGEHRLLPGPDRGAAYGRGTFKTFGCEDDQGYLHKYSIADSIEDGTTLPLYCNLAPNAMLVPHETLDKESRSAFAKWRNTWPRPVRTTSMRSMRICRPSTPR